MNICISMYEGEEMCMYECLTGMTLCMYVFKNGNSVSMNVYKCVSMDYDRNLG